MKHSICGFNHAALLLNFKCNYDDAQILRCIVDFRDTGRMQQVNIEGKIYFWLFYQWLLDQLPGLHCKNSRVLSRWMDKYVDNGLMERYVANGNRTYYRFIESQYEILVSYPKEKMVTPVLQSTPPCTPEYTPPVLQSTPIDSSLIDSSRKKEDNKGPTPNPPKEENPQNKTYLPISQYLLEKIKTSGTDAVFNDTHLKSWNNHFRLMVEQDHRTVEQIRSKIDAVFNDAFWSKVIRSAGTLRERWKEGKLDRLEPLKPKKPQFSGISEDYYKKPQQVCLPGGTPFNPETYQK